MMTLAQKGAAFATLLVLDLALLSVGGVVIGLAALMALVPMAGTIAIQ